MSAKDLKRMTAGLVFGLAMVLGHLAWAGTQQNACLDRGAKKQKLHVQVLGYRGWKMEIVVTNKSQQAQWFRPDGLYFIPKGSAEKAPQRLAASGPFYQRAAGTWKRNAARIKIPAQSKQRLRLEVFCLDSHRPSPKNGQAFRLASKRLPKSLRRSFRRNSRKYMKQYKSRGKFRGANQSMIWRIRNKKWIKLEGERKNERARQNKRPRNQYYRQRRRGWNSINFRRR